MIPTLNREDIKNITKQLNEAQVKYVSSVAELMDTINAMQPECKQSEDILFIAKMMAFGNKFRLLHWAAANMSSHNLIDDICETINEYVDSIAENVQGINGDQFSVKEFDSICLPFGKEEDPLVVLDNMKEAVQTWFDLHKDEAAYEGCRNITSGMLESIYKYFYLIRICKKG